MADSSDQFLGNIIKSPKIRGYLYDAGRALGIGLSLTNVGVVYLMSQHTIGAYPVWLGAATAVYTAGAPYVFGVAKSNLPDFSATPVVAPIATTEVPPVETPVAP